MRGAIYECNAVKPVSVGPELSEAPLDGFAPLSAWGGSRFLNRIVVAATLSEDA